MTHPFAYSGRPRALKGKTGRLPAYMRLAAQGTNMFRFIGKVWPLQH
jgi:hypothetical protein